MVPLLLRNCTDLVQESHGSLPIFRGKAAADAPPIAGERPAWKGVHAHDHLAVREHGCVFPAATADLACPQLLSRSCKTHNLG
eukprot:CAMPEP_0180814582 /NCGR_PEP_ID=MMETSP1038_2-20121128/67146_1 /TAXON_ID=632150 /ORGANISM="Azadinium spinosum, Strain 3D9" /LENGTH=82 /DNA_ID=CAMNT_0022856251 /DNA_START=448 /DNA_END=692 /DNA_ORIENTATION=-